MLRAANFLYSTAVEEEKLDLIKEGIAEEKAAKAAHGAMTGGFSGNSWGGNPGVYGGTPEANVTPVQFSEVEGDDDTPDITPGDEEAEAIVALEADVAVTEEDDG